MLPQLWRMFEQVFSGAQAASRVVAFWGPVIDVGVVTRSLLAVVSVLALAMLTGIAVGTLSTLLLTVAALYVLLTEVFGVTVDFDLA